MGAIILAFVIVELIAWHLASNGSTLGVLLLIFGPLVVVIPYLVLRSLSKHHSAPPRP